MTDKKFPTPNYDAATRDPGFMSPELAIQADIAMAVKGAVKVPDALIVETLMDGLRKMDEAAFDGNNADLSRDVSAARRWLESLIVAGKVETALVPMQFVETRTKTGGNTFAVDSIEPVKPVEKRCGTCAYFVLRTDWSENYGQCNRSVIPSTTTNRCGDMCLCWKAKG